MYVVNIVVAGGFGVMWLVAPDTIASMVGATAEIPMWAAGYAYCFMISLAVFAVFGLRSPLKFSSALLVQATTKILWILAVFLPAIVAGTAPSWALMLTGLFVVWVIGDFIVIPWRHFLAK
jgi:hypothetical protein